MEFDMMAAIAECERLKKPDEEVVFAVGAGRVMPKTGMIRKQKEALKYINELDGFLGFNMLDKWHTLLIFDTRMNATLGRNGCASKGIGVGNVAPVLVKTAFIEAAKKWKEAMKNEKQ